MEIFLIAIGITVLAVIYKRLTQASEFELMCTLQGYLKANPECQTDRGIKCRYCNSNSIKNWGRIRADDTDRVFICNHCGESLYRSDTVIKSFASKRNEADHDPWQD